MSVTAVLSYSSIYSWLLNSCMPHFPTLFFLASSQTLGSCQISYLQLLFSSDCCCSFTHTHTHIHSYTSLSGGEEGGSETFSSVLFPAISPRSTPGSFIFISALPSWVCLGKKNIVTCASPVPLSSFPRVLHRQVREVFWVLLCSSSSVAAFVYQGRWWQSFTPSS